MVLFQFTPTRNAIKRDQEAIDGDDGTSLLRPVVHADTQQQGNDENGITFLPTVSIHTMDELSNFNGMVNITSDSCKQS